MATGKRYYWIKLKEDFFRDKDIKKLRSMAGGDTLTVIYLKMLLLALPTDGKLEYTGLEEDFASEIALTIDEDPDNVTSVISFLIKRGLLTECKPDEYELTAHKSMVGSESESAERVRRHREKYKLLQSNGTVTNCNTEIEKEREIEKEIEKDTTTTDDSTNIGEVGGGGGGFSLDIIKYAENAAKGAEHPAAYKAAILDRIRAEGYTTLAEVQEADRQRKSKSKSKGASDPTKDVVKVLEDGTKIFADGTRLLPNGEKRGIGNCLIL